MRPTSFDIRAPWHVTPGITETRSGAPPRAALPVPVLGPVTGLAAFVRRVPAMAAATRHAPLPRDQKVLGHLVDALELLRTRSAEVWPGFTWEGRCVVMNRQASPKLDSAYHYVIGHPGLDASYTKLPYANADVRFKGEQLADASSFRFIDFRGKPAFFTNFANNLDGHLGNPNARRDAHLAMATFCLHEMFHDHQGRISQPPEPSQTPFSEYLDHDNMTLAVLEMHVAAAYAAGSIGAQQAAFDLVALRRERERSFGDSARNDAYMEAIEGTPTFVEHGALLALGATAEADAFLGELRDLLTRDPEFSTMIRNRAYPFGCVVSRILREKLGAVSDDYLSKTPMGLLAEISDFPPEALERRAAELRTGPAAKVAKEKAERCIATQRTAMNRARELFDGTLPRIVLPKMRGFSATDVIMFPNDLWAGKFAFYQRDANDVASIHQQNQSYLGVSIGDVHLQRLPKDAQIAVDGRAAVPLELGGDISFAKSARIVGKPGFDLKLEGGGTLKVGANQTLVYVPTPAASFHAPMTAAAERFKAASALRELQRSAMPILEP